MVGLVLASLGFMAIHAVPATPLRVRLIALVGEGAYLGLFSFASLLLLGLAAVAYGNALPAPALWRIGLGLQLAIAALMVVPFWLVVVSVTARNPAGFNGAPALAANAAPAGVFTVTRHPMMIGIALWALLHLVANPDLPSFALFGSLIMTALGGAVLQDRRKGAEIGTAWRRYVAQTSLVPFMAILDGRTRLDTAGFNARDLFIAFGLWAVVLVLHGPLIGTAALAP